MDDFPHFTLSGIRTTEDFTTPPSGGGEHQTPPRPERATHADKLLTDLDPSTTCADVKGRAESKISDIEAKIESLKRMKRALVKVTKACSGRRETSDCPILDVLDGEEET